MLGNSLLGASLFRMHSKPPTATGVPVKPARARFPSQPINRNTELSDSALQPNSGSEKFRSPWKRDKNSWSAKRTLWDQSQAPNLFRAFNETVRLMHSRLEHTKLDEAIRVGPECCSFQDVWCLLTTSPCRERTKLLVSLCKSRILSHEHSAFALSKSKAFLGFITLSTSAVDGCLTNIPFYYRSMLIDSKKDRKI
jgi:hypothetical protein